MLYQHALPNTSMRLTNLHKLLRSNILKTLFKKELPLIYQTSNSWHLLCVRCYSRSLVYVIEQNRQNSLPSWSLHSNRHLSLQLLYFTKTKYCKLTLHMVHVYLTCFLKKNLWIFAWLEDERREVCCGERVLGDSPWEGRMEKNQDHIKATYMCFSIIQKILTNEKKN